MKKKHLRPDHVNPNTLSRAWSLTMEATELDKLVNGSRTLLVLRAEDYDLKTGDQFIIKTGALPGGVHFTVTEVRRCKLQNVDLTGLGSPAEEYPGKWNSVHSRTPWDCNPWVRRYVLRRSDWVTGKGWV